MGQAKDDLVLVLTWDILDEANPLLSRKSPRMDYAKEAIETALEKWLSSMTPAELTKILMKLRTLED